MKCPNCGYANSDETTVCNSCGINLNEYDSKSEIYKSAKAEQVNQRVIEATFRDVTKEKKFNEKQKNAFWRQLKIILLIGIILIIFFSGGAYLYSQYIKNQTELAINSFSDAMGCYEQLQFECALENLDVAAKNGFNPQQIEDLKKRIYESLANEKFIDGDYSDAVQKAEDCIKFNHGNTFCQSIICDSKIEISKRFIDAGEWRDAIETLDEAILVCVDPASAKEYQNDIFRRWIQEEDAKSHFFQANKIRLEWKARYPENN